MLSIGGKGCDVQRAGEQGGGLRPCERLAMRCKRDGHIAWLQGAVSPRVAIPLRWFGDGKGVDHLNDAPFTLGNSTISCPHHHAKCQETRLFVKS
jgi:hypothetical protein